MKKRALFCWSGGKDSALALYEILKDPDYEIVSLLTTVNSDFKRISMHGVSEELLNIQVDAIGLPLEKVYIETSSDNSTYEDRMNKVLLMFQAKEVEYVVFGDIFLEDLRRYREENLAKVGMKAIFPLWKKNTSDLVKEFIELGFKTITCCVYNKFLNDSFAGVIIDESFIDSLPTNVDPCGENGEFHTFVFDGPIFKEGLKIGLGEKVTRTYEIKEMINGIEYVSLASYCFVDLLPE